MNQQAERAMAQCRKYLRYAHEFERAGEIELADAAGAIAANKVAASIRINERDAKVVTLRSRA